MTYDPSAACACPVPCPICERTGFSLDAIHLHNLRAACHGERTYPGTGTPTVPSRRPTVYLAVPEADPDDTPYQALLEGRRIL